VYPIQITEVERFDEWKHLVLVVAIFTKAARTTNHMGGLWSCFDGPDATVSRV